MTSTSTPLHKTDLPELANRGKVRDVYNLGGKLMIVATDRVSAFDVVMDQPVPGKGILLTELSRFWLETLSACQPHHLEYVVSDERVPASYEPYVAQLRGRAMVVKRVEILPIECIVRGYIAGSGWKEYQQRGTICGIELPPGLRKSEQLPEPIFTPTTKATVGHDEAVTWAQAEEILDSFLTQKRSRPGGARELLAQVRDRSLAIYRQAADYAAARGLLLADTKFEFGLFNGELLLADEVLTPDSSRFWPTDRYEVGVDQTSFDKQVLRDYLETLAWNKQPPPPPLPPDVIAKLQAAYEDAYRRLTA
ncbi:MAG: phosphoribosylaminoimidazolesuccinocarboxamide synthase [Phycisphaerales bacterium]|nr:phosphoribosylaminoimidazolesuccinocarboxamide synthase [Phycisphaerales bacterium]